MGYILLESHFSADVRGQQHCYLTSRDSQFIGRKDGCLYNLPKSDKSLSAETFANQSSVLRSNI